MIAATRPFHAEYMAFLWRSILEKAALERVWGREQLLCDLADPWRDCDRDGIPDRDFYTAFNLFRLAGILQGIAGRVRDGTASSAHARQAEASVAPLAELGRTFMERA